MSSSDSPVSVVPTYIAAGRFSTASDDNHAASIWISTLLCLIYSWIVLFLRAHLRWDVYSLDDYVIFGATVLQSAEVVALVIALQHGLGQSHLLLTAEQISNTNTATFAGILFFIAATCFAKISIILLMMRLFNLSGPRSSRDSRSRILWTACLTTIALAALWGLCSIAGLLAKCSIPLFTTASAEESCPQQALRWDIIAIFDIITELLIVILSIVIVWPVQLKVTMKIPIIFAFSFRLPCAVASIVHIYYINIFASSIKPTTDSSSQEPGLAIVPVIILMQIQLCWSMISATIPNLKSFVRSFNSGFGLGIDPEFMSSGGYHKYPYISSSSSHTRSRDTTRRGTNDETTTIYELSAVRSGTSSKGNPRNYSNTSTIHANLTCQQQHQKEHSPLSFSLPSPNPPRRPSRTNVDLDGIGLQAGIPAIPGFGATGTYPAHVVSYKPAANVGCRSLTASVSAASSPHTCRGSSEGDTESDSGIVDGGSGGGFVGGRSTPVCEIEGSEIMSIGCAAGAGSREHIIRKDMQYEVRYEMA